MPSVAIYGSTGYTALELIRILLRHPEAEITALTTRQEHAPSIAEIHPSLTGRLDLPAENLTPAEVASRADVVFCCLPHAASMAAVPELISSGCRVIDLSADYRLTDPGVYEQWYKTVHTDPTRLGSTVYGLPELFREAIPEADLIANPGCYTSTSILTLAPLLANGLIEPTGIIIDAKSGVSGAGRTPKLGTLYAECNESVSAYAVGQHRHTPEIEQVLSTMLEQRAEAEASSVRVTFTPHLMPMDRGILATIYPRAIGNPSADDLLAAMRSFYEGEPFIRVVDTLPTTKQVAFTNEVHLTARKAGDQIVLIGVLDNLLKGAAGVAVQNYNLMCGFDEETALVV